MKADSRQHPVLVFDGDCVFCTRCARLLERIGPDAEIVAWQLADLPALGLTEEQANDAVQWVAADGTVRSGHEAIAAALGSAGRIWQLAARLLLLPGISPIAAKTYRLVADNRSRLHSVGDFLSHTERKSPITPPSEPRSSASAERRRRRAGRGCG